MIRTQAGVEKANGRPAPPPVYRPHAIGSASSAPPVYRAHAAVQPKAMPSPPPVYRPQPAPARANAVASRMAPPRTNPPAHRPPYVRSALQVPERNSAVQRFRLAAPPKDFGDPQKPSLTVATRDAIIGAAIASDLAPELGGPSDPLIGGKKRERHFHCRYCQLEEFAAARQIHPQHMTAIDHIDPSNNFLKGKTYGSPKNPRLDIDKLSGIVNMGTLTIGDDVDEKTQRWYRQLIYNDLDNLHVVCAGHNQRKAGAIDFHHHQESGGISFHTVDSEAARSGRPSYYNKLHSTSHKTSPPLLQGPSRIIPQLTSSSSVPQQQGGGGFPTYPPTQYGGPLPTPFFQQQGGSGFPTPPSTPYPSGGGFVSTPQYQPQYDSGFLALPPAPYGGSLPTPPFQYQGSGGFPTQPSSPYSSGGSFASTSQYPPQYGGGYPTSQTVPYASSGGFVQAPQQHQHQSGGGFNPPFSQWGHQ